VFIWEGGLQKRFGGLGLALGVSRGYVKFGSYYNNSMEIIYIIPCGSLRERGKTVGSR
jgi:hypothetical protein